MNSDSRVALFLRNRVTRQIQINGVECEFQKVTEDSYHQKVLSNVRVIVKGLFHTSSSYVSSKDNEDSRITKKQQPMILMLYEDGVKISKDDVLTYDTKKYTVLGKQNVNELNVAFEVSLEEVQ